MVVVAKSNGKGKGKGRKEGRKGEEMPATAGLNL